MTVNVANKIGINLGPFNCCIDDVSGLSRVEYPVGFFDRNDDDHGVRVFYYDDESNIKSRHILNLDESPGVLSLTTFIINGSSDQQDSLESRAEIIDSFARKIIDMIYAIVNKMDVPLCRDRVVIPIKKVKMRRNGRTGTPYGWIEFGLAIFV